MNQNDVLDEGELLETVQGDRELMSELIALFLDDAPTQIAAIRAAIAAEDPLELKATAHSLKGAATTLAAGCVSAAAHQLELLGAAGVVEGAATRFMELEEAFARLRERLATLPAST